ncbi:MAG: hypothetical protein WCG27_04740, partial [Pseudomonadota bacterium]
MDESIKDTIVLINSKRLLVPALAKVVKRIQKEGDPLIHVPETIQEAIQVCSMTECGIIFAPMHKKEDVVEIVQILNVIKSNLKNDFVKFLVYNFLPDDQKIESLMMKKGVSEFIDVGMNEKSLIYKINLSFRAIKSNYKRFQESQKKQDVQQFTADIDYSKLIIFKGPINEAFDYWSIKNKKDLSFIKEQWEMEISGPHPCLGNWEEVKKENNKMRVWKWSFHSQVDPKLDRDGFWFFIGEKPEYVSGRKAWMMVSQTPAFFFHSKTKTSYKVKFDKKTVIVAKDSRMAIENIVKLEEIAAAIGFEYDEDAIRLEQNAEHITTHQTGETELKEELSENMKGDIKGGSDQIDANLEGKGEKSDQVDNQWGGDVNSTEQVDKNMQGNIQDGEGPLNGNLKGEGGQAMNLSNLGRNNKTKREGFKDDEKNGHWGGEIKTTEGIKGKLSTADKQSGIYKEEELDDAWGGNVKGTDKIKDRPNNPRDKKRMLEKGKNKGPMEGEGGEADQIKGKMGGSQ